MNILALDTSTKNFSAVIARGEEIIAKRTFTLKKLLDSSIIPSIEALLKEADLTISDIDCFAIGVGPGSFTSLRVGVSTIKALAFACKKPIVTISSLDLIALNVKKNQPFICVLVDAKRNLFYSAAYQKHGQQLKRMGDYQLSSIEEIVEGLQSLDQCVFVGDGIALVKDFVSKKYKGKSFFTSVKEGSPLAQNLIVHALEQIGKKKFMASEKLVPLYLYPHDCQVRR